MELANKVVAITGAGQGLGKQMALSLAESGVNLALIDLNLEQLRETQAECESLGVNARVYVTNVTNEQQVCAAFEQIEADFKQLNGVINNAGIMRDGMFIKVKDGQITPMSLEQFQSVMDVNVTGTFLCGREASKVMLNTDSKGVLINISSVARAGNIGQTNYSASKAAVATMATVWAKELGRFGIRSVAIAPGVIKTAMTDQIKPEAMDRLIKMIPVGRLGLADEISATVKYALTNEFVTGRVLEVDGGMRM
ncbi:MULTISPECIES: SDR family oxidoreductase [Vibrio]|jgi:3-oxoacyl-[acyl-carrier protein] reductase|uniref:3-oxoacyl-ACP reductase n=1 Tax=Vibrio natriegens NBRC 15636 = ATCC 14048 = DSM 759 TaxID=1219067 RepID=A0AAN0Y7Q6_VIBNA|nr:MULTISPECIES: SDR family oxidoreductase [Vibrio]CAH0528552.1 3-oxoacyl-[acyl-carrier-protein] reductase FabG [Catenococcus thiocycli]AEX24135.1 3-ketoacyl-(acyl-carrier-protein) reductase [Vibrio sp. EJY3]ALR18056.1 3-ketoacyl-ACP reductase [Vibrio natriegens NBRC 15636 = ATCC 14048 = DSM 759]ANQ15556.1 3-oxoacyl-ACP reductase [Vibrio natriegens NBRC 15636 = ATCC 14048 = DSM 759]EPM41525.1 3-ketoacyl-ACP reductase [Vibrio natriegens NBRC 15636 = ATCC 14048 = DSM 759]